MPVHEILHLQWLGNQSSPMWGGHLERGEPISDPEMRGWLDRGLIEAVDHPSKGYILTEKGRAYVGGGL